MRGTRAKSKVILVIDDDPEIGEVLEMAVSMQGYSVRVAENEEAALEILQTVTPAIVLLDYYGVSHATKDTVSRLRTAHKSVPIVLMTGAREPEVKARRLGVKHTLPKPFQLDALQKLLHMHGIKPQMERVCKATMQISLFS